MRWWEPNPLTNPPTLQSSDAFKCSKWKRNKKHIAYLAYLAYPTYVAYVLMCNKPVLTISFLSDNSICFNIDFIPISHLFSIYYQFIFLQSLITNDK